MTDARAAILSRLRATETKAPPPLQDFQILESRGWSAEEKLQRLRQQMEAVHTEFLDARGQDWPTAVQNWLSQEKLPGLIYGPKSTIGAKLSSQWNNGVPLIPYDRAMEQWKAELFAFEGAGITATRGAIAQTGSLILFTSADEPRTLSLVPPVHIALLNVGKIRDTWRQVMQEQAWVNNMPTNLLLISGPSKTADIEQTLAYGVHGPKRLLVVLTDED